MKFLFELNSKKYSFDTKEAQDISIALNFNGEQPNIYGAPIATTAAFITNEFVGDTRKGGSANCEQHVLIPHCNGTHTECIGHITNERIGLVDILKQPFCPAVLISLKPQSASDCSDTYNPPKAAADFLITNELLAKKLGQVPKEFLEAIIIRTLPNDASKQSRKYDEEPAAYFSIEAMQYLNTLPLQHLLVDFASVDRANDQGQLSAHHIYWDIQAGKYEAEKLSSRTITEMIYVPDRIKDGLYLLNLGAAPFMSDAAPSRPFLYEVRLES